MNYLNVIQDVASVASRCRRNPKEITVIAVSKYHPIEALLQVYASGCRDFGESRIQEVLPKIESAPEDIKWHLIGSLQKNKVNKVIGKFNLIHSVDSFELAQKISEASALANQTTSILLQVNTSNEASKHGFTPGEVRSSFDKLQSLPNLKIEGLMTMAPLTQDETLVRHTFLALRLLKEELSPKDKTAFKHLSMGMSHDYAIAIEEGATLLRIGSKIFQEKGIP